MNMKKNQNLTWDEINNRFAQTEQLIKEEMQLIKESRKEREEERKEREEERKEREKERKEREKERKEREKERKEERKEINQRWDLTRQELDRIAQQVGGISHSNGEMAETYFYNAFKANKTFANEKFDRVKRNLAYKKEDIEAEFDIVLFNGKSAAIIEVKYNAKHGNVRAKELIARVEIFKILYPEYKDYNIYLGVAAMSFRKGLETKLHNAGIATVRQIGRKMVVYDQDVRAF